PDDVEVLSALLELRRAAGDPQGLAAALALRAAAEIDPFARAALIAEAARLEEEELARPDQAIASYRAALDDDPTCAPAASGLRRLLRDREEWQVLADLLRRLTDEPPAGATPRERAALHHELGEVLGEHLGRPDEAVRAFEAALELEPRDAAAYHGLKQVYRATNRKAELLEILEAELDAIGTPAEAHRYGDIARERAARGEHERAAAAWRKLLAASPGDRAGHEGLAAALRQLGRLDELADACRARLEVTEDAAERAAIHLELSAALEEAGDLEGAIAAGRDAAAGGDAAAGDALARLYERAARWGDALEVLERLQSAAGDDRDRKSTRL